MKEFHVSGSLDLKEALKELEEMVEESWFAEGLSEMCQSTYSLQFDKTKKDKVWLFNTGRRTFLPYSWGLTLQPVEAISIATSDISDEIPCMIGYDLVLVPHDYIVDVGWN